MELSPKGFAKCDWLTICHWPLSCHAVWNIRPLQRLDKCYHQYYILMIYSISCHKVNATAKETGMSNLIKWMGSPDEIRDKWTFFCKLIKLIKCGTWLFVGGTRDKGPKCRTVPHNPVHVVTLGGSFFACRAPTERHWMSSITVVLVFIVFVSIALKCYQLFWLSLPILSIWIANSAGFSVAFQSMRPWGNCKRAIVALLYN